MAGVIPSAASSSSSSGFIINKRRTTFINTTNYPSHSSLLLLGLITKRRNQCGGVKVRAIKEETNKKINNNKNKNSTSSEADEVTQKYGLEVGLWKIFSSKDDDNQGTKSKGDQAKELLAKYGGAYLATSITLSLISFSLCYVLINAGVDVPALLQKVGISANETGEKVGTFALAYAAHKAASPIRFPPTVALTPIVASWIGKKVDKDN